MNVCFENLCKRIITLNLVCRLHVFTQEGAWKPLNGPPVPSSAHAAYLPVEIEMQVLYRFIAIVFPLKAHEVCTRRNIVGAILFIWPLAFGCGLPVALYNVEVPRRHTGDKMCVIRLPGENRHYSFMVYKFTEAAFFYFIPMLLQIVLYSIIAKRLFASNAALNGRISAPHPSKTPLFAPQAAHRKKSPASDTIRARKGVVKMLISSVLLYCLSYSPLQARLIYKSFIASPGNPPNFFDSMEFFVFVMVVTHINSAANPVLYAIFSQNFRRNFQRSLCCACCRRDGGSRSSSQDTRLLSRRSTRSSSAFGRTVATTM
ncbi:neuropeptide receptor 15-like [Elysia marginata]|uniref:Thyrotropin-releasing hormone receptor n=1 Tax=Elysia marginata TaxID=1093978 RepID=A0AAV4HE40_9GAST|nr:neuropeptide receptor 15-like [Elysia marginata]